MNFHRVYLNYYLIVQYFIIL